MNAEAAPDSRTPLSSPARLPRRLAAIVYDGLLLAGVLLVATALALGLAVAILGSESVRLHSPLQGNPFFSTYLLLVCFFFYGGFWIHGGQTLGMRAWRLRVQQRDGRNIGWWQALLRFLIAGLGWSRLPLICIGFSESGSVSAWALAFFVWRWRWPYACLTAFRKRNWWCCPRERRDQRKRCSARNPAAKKSSDGKIAPTNGG
jgi:uncharacterized RDD family membrane protein YckC